MKEFCVLETPRLNLRALSIEDWKEIAYLRSDMTVNKYVSRPSARNQKEALAFIYKIQKGIRKKELLYWSVSLKENPKMIGSICLWHFSKDKTTAEVGYDLAANQQGKGIMNEALQAIINYAFYDLQLIKIEAFTHYKNNKSLSLLERNSFVLNPNRKDKGNENNIILELKA